MNKEKELVTKQYKIKKLHHKGFGIPTDVERELEIWNALPGEIVEISFIKGARFRRTSFAAENIVEKSPRRVEPVETDHFLSCSPWQIVDWKEENRLKAEIVQDLFKDYDIPVKTQNIFPENSITDNQQSSYRNKMEFSFYIDENERINLAFHKRGSKGITPVSGCMLASESINQTGKIIIDWINENKIPKKILKTVIIRSNKKGETIAGLFIKDETINAETLHATSLLNNNFKGFSIYYSNGKCPASVADKLLFEDGECWLEEEIIHGDGRDAINRVSTQLKYGLLSFFQINIPIFEKALEVIHSEIPDNSDVVDFYSGVGSISLPVADRCKNLTLVDSNEESIEFANKNIENNKISNAKAICLPAEKITELITSDKIIVVDPPRSGMHPDVVERLLQEQPSKIIYLSCNPNSQAMDLKLLKEKYSIKSVNVFNFFPRTPHIESLVILERR